MTENDPRGTSARHSEADDPATLDAAKTFKITVVSALLFVLAALFIILRTRIG